MDFVNDQNPRAIYLADELVGLPEYVKSAKQIQPEDLTGLDRVAFADPVGREYPIFDKAATWLSAAYAAGVPGLSTTVSERIKTAAEFHGITADVEKLLTAVFSHSKAASAPPEIPYALKVDFGGHGGNLGLQNFYPIADDYDILKSARQMLTDFDEGRLPLEYFRSAAQELVKAAADKGIDYDNLHPRVLAVGEERLPDFEHALKCANLRTKAGVDEAGLELYKAAAYGARDEPGQMSRWLDLWLDLDATYGVKYAAYQPNPYEAFFSGERVPDLNKVAGEVVIIEGVMIPKSAVAGIPEGIVQQNFTKAAAGIITEAVKKASEHPELAGDLLEKIKPGERKEFLQIVLRAA